MDFAKFIRTLLLRKTTGQLLLLITVSIVVKVKLTDQTVNYDTEIKTYQFKPNLCVSYQKSSPSERLSLTRVFEEGVQNKIKYDSQRYIPRSTGKSYLLPQKSPFR